MEGRPGRLGEAGWGGGGGRGEADMMLLSWAVSLDDGPSLLAGGKGIS